VSAVTTLLPQVEVDAAVADARARRFPAGAQMGFGDLEDAGGEAALDTLRDAEPVSWLPALGGWLVTGHAAAREALSPRTATTVEAEPNLVRASLGRMMLTADAAEHTRMRAPFEPPFRMRESTAAFGAAIGETADALVEAIAAAGECELGAAFAAPFAIRMAGRILGLSLGDAARIDGLYTAFAGAMTYDGDPEPQRRADAARDELDAILQAEIARSRERADTSVTSQVANAPAAALTDSEIAAQLRVIMFGAIETIQGAVMNTMLLLLRNPGELARVRSSDPGLLGAAVDEALRLIPPVAFIERWTRAPVRIGAVDLGPGEFVGVSVIAANRDPAVFPDPARFDVGRPNARHALSFSFGEHHCLGAHLARIETTTAVSRLLALPQLRLVTAVEPAGFAFRRPKSLQLAWAPTPS
jgi:cytochrome P450